MQIDLNILNHLGLSLYSNTPAVLSEVVANSYDADATEVKIYTNQETEEITIIDNGNGMNADEINKKFLTVGYQKRKDGFALSENLKRKVMGRKGIGKLSLLSIARTIQIHTKKKDTDGEAFEMSIDEINANIETNRKKEIQIPYSPKEITFDTENNGDHGTKIIIKEVKKSIARTPEFVRKRLARRFLISENNFAIYVNDKIISIEDRDYYNKIENLWIVGNYTPEDSKLNIVDKLSGKLSGEKFEISGWIGTVEKPSDLDIVDDTNNKVSIICRGKLAQEDILKFYNEGGLYSNYLIGEIHADFLDDDNSNDIATSSRQSFNENEERFILLKDHIYILLKKIQSRWTKLRKEKSKDKAVAEIPILEEWYDGLKSSDQEHAKTLFSTIESMHFDGDIEKKKEFYKFGILSFERLNSRKKLDELSRLKDIDIEKLIKFKEIFTELQDIEATLYYDIAYERVNIIKKLHEATDDNVKEKILQQHLFENLWLLDSSWERATAGTQLIEQNVKKAFKDIDVNLDENEKKARFDIKYRTSSGKHIIIELKRYKTGYKVDEFELMKQINKYINGLKKCLNNVGESNPYIEVICVVGPTAVEDLNNANNHLKTLNARIVFYDQLIENALQSYSLYVEKNKAVGKIRTLIDKL